MIELVLIVLGFVFAFVLGAVLMLFAVDAWVQGMFRKL